MSDDLATLAQLFIDFATASLLAIGGGSAVLPELHKVVVTDTHWLNDQQFKEIYSLGQIAPGPNMTIVAIIGQHVAGWAGALVTLVAFFLPSSLLAFGVTLSLILQAAVNVGVVLGLLPTKGLTLPFVSYGGSAIIASLAQAGVLVALARETG